MQDPDPIIDQNTTIPMLMMTIYFIDVHVHTLVRGIGHFPGPVRTLGIVLTLSRG